MELIYLYKAMNKAQLLVSKCQICNTGHFVPSKCNASGWVWV